MNGITWRKLRYIMEEKHTRLWERMKIVSKDLNMEAHLIQLHQFCESVLYVDTTWRNVSNLVFDATCFCFRVHKVCSLTYISLRWCYNQSNFDTFIHVVVFGRWVQRHVSWILMRTRGAITYGHITVHCGTMRCYKRQKVCISRCKINC